MGVDYPAAAGEARGQVSCFLGQRLFHLRGAWHPPRDVPAVPGRRHREDHHRTISPPCTSVPSPRLRPTVVFSSYLFLGGVCQAYSSLSGRSIPPRCEGACSGGPCEDLKLRDQTALGGQSDISLQCPVWGREPGSCFARARGRHEWKAALAFCGYTVDPELTSVGLACHPTGRCRHLSGKSLMNWPAACL